MLLLADYIPTPVASASPAAARTPQRGWNVSSSTSPTLPSLSLRSIQQEETVLLPAVAVVRGGVGVSPQSVVWGRADVLRVGKVVAVSGVREVQEQEERQREEERLKRLVEELTERERAEAKLRKKEARKQREAERKEEKQRQQAQQEQQQPAALSVVADAGAPAAGVAHENGAHGRGSRGGGVSRGGGGRGGRGGSRGGGRGGAAALPAVSVYDVLGVSKPAATGPALGESHVNVRGGRGGGGRGGGQGRRRSRGHAEWVAKKHVGLDEHKDVTVVHAMQQRA